MKIYHIKINGITNPIGFDYSHLTVSYYFDGLPKNSIFIGIYKEEHCNTVIYKQDINLDESFCTPLAFIPENETRYYIRFFGEDCESEIAFFETGTDFDCEFITPIEDISHPVIFKNFSIKSARIVSARLYITGLGLYEAFLNEKKVGNEFLTPGCNDYDAYVQYQTYDVTSQIGQDNNLEIALGNGWYKGRFGLKHRINIYGSKYVAAAKLVVKYADGNTESITTDESWSARPSYVTASSIYDGEIVDRTLDTIKICGVNFYNNTLHVIPRVSLPIVVKERIKPVLLISPKGEKILDFGQNFSGFVAFNGRMQRGQALRLQAGEVLQNDCFYRENLRTAKAEFVYVSDGIIREVRPQFTFYGFRYMLVEGLNEVNVGDFSGNAIYSDMEQTVRISTDSEKVNRLLLNCLWGQKSNFVDVPTDCPQRDERLGWTGDAEVFSKTACYQMDCKVFYDKYLKDIAVDQQLCGGMITNYSPTMKEPQIACSIWGDAATIIPWNLYYFYGDQTLLEKHYCIMKQYVDCIVEKDNKHDGKRLYNFGFHLGDWLSQDGITPSALRGATDEFFIASVYYYNSVKIVAESAKILGNQSDYEYYSALGKDIREAILEEYFTSTGRLAIDTQTAYVICVMFDIYKDRDCLVNGFKTRIKRDNYKIKGGFVGATQLIQSLISCGLTSAAFRMLYSQKYPGWLACVNLGATTIWERWNSLNEDGSISGTEMNSFNHYSYGAVAEAFYGYMAGIRPLSPGFKRAIIEPKLNYRLRKLDFEFDSPSGTYAVYYVIKADDMISLRIIVPYGAQANLRLEGQKDQVLNGGVYEYTFAVSEELNSPFSINSRMCDLLANDESCAILKANVPTLYRFLSSSDIGINGESLRSIGKLDSFYILPETLEIIDDQLREIKI